MAKCCVSIISPRHKDSQHHSHGVQEAQLLSKAMGSSLPCTPPCIHKGWGKALFRFSRESLVRELGFPLNCLHIHSP